jgi:HK97 family phage major capsid protein
MSKLMKLLKSLLAKGFATAVEKAEVKTLYKELDADGQEVLKDDADKADALPEEDPKKTSEEDDDLEKNIKALVTKAVKEATEEQTVKALDGIKSEVKTFMESQKKAIEAKAGLYNADVKEKRHGVNTYLRKFTRAVLSNDVNELMKLNNAVTVKELTTDKTGSPFGGYVTDHELSAEIRLLTTEYGVARQEMTMVQLSKNSYDYNTLVTDVTVYWVDEGDTILSTQVVLGQQELKLKKLAAICTLTRELLEDEEIDLFSFIAGRVAEGFAHKEDSAFFMGTGPSDTANGGFTGIVYNALTNPYSMAVSKDSINDLTADDLLGMQDASPQSIAKNGKYYGHRSIRNIVRKLKTKDGVYIYQDPTNNGPAMLWGRPFVEVEVMPDITSDDVDTEFLIYGDLKKACLFGYKGSIAADKFNAGLVRNVANNADINLITTDREAVRWIERVGYITLMPTCITVLKTGSGS